MERELRRRFEHMEERLVMVHDEVRTLWALVEKQRRRMDAIQRRLTGVKRSKRR